MEFMLVENCLHKYFSQYFSWVHRFPRLLWKPFHSNPHRLAINARTNGWDQP